MRLEELLGERDQRGDVGCRCRAIAFHRGNPRVDFQQPRNAATILRPLHET